MPPEPRPDTKRVDMVVQLIPGFGAVVKVVDLRVIGVLELLGNIDAVIRGAAPFQPPAPPRQCFSSAGVSTRVPPRAVMIFFRSSLIFSGITMVTG